MKNGLIKYLCISTIATILLAGITVSILLYFESFNATRTSCFIAYFSIIPFVLLTASVIEKIVLTYTLFKHKEDVLNNKN